MRIIGIDSGERRIGVAAADDGTRIAVPLTTVTVSGDPVEAIVRLAEEEQAGEIVVGLPLSLSGALGPQAQRVMAQVAELEARLSVPVRTWDERLTTAEAGHRAKTASGRKGSRSRKHADRSREDAIAAAIMLQAYLDSQR